MRLARLASEELQIRIFPKNSAEFAEMALTSRTMPEAANSPFLCRGRPCRRPIRGHSLPLNASDDLLHSGRRERNLCLSRQPRRQRADAASASRPFRIGALRRMRGFIARHSFRPPRVRLTQRGRTRVPNPGNAANFKVKHKQSVVGHTPNGYAAQWQGREP